MRVWTVTPEVAPFSKTGGLGDVAASLPRALAEQGTECAIVTPRYRTTVPLERMDLALDVRVGNQVIRAGVETALLPDSRVRVYLLRHDPFFDRDFLYGTPYGDYGDNLQRFTFLSRGAVELSLALGERPDILHLHDWQTGLVPVYTRTHYSNAFARSRTVMTVHNLAYQGMFSDHHFPLTGLDWRRFNWRELEFYGRVNLLKGGLVYADAITTVSPTYALQIQEQEFGCGLDGVLKSRARDLVGILNGIDLDQWDPKTDLRLPVRFDAENLKGKTACKAALQREIGLPEEAGALLFGIVGRFASQKGFDLLAAAAPAIAELGVQGAILGNGDESIAAQVRGLAAKFPRNFAVRTAFDDGLARRITAGADAFLMPSRYEPCGLGQIYAMRYGTVPIVHATGGLADTVTPETGIRFEVYDAGALVGAVRAALDAFRTGDAWSRLMLGGMRQDFSWSRSARDYLKLFRRALEAPPRAAVAE